MQEAGEGECFVDDVFALFVLEVVGNPEILKELQKLHCEKK
jgi:hypothetical protein